MKLITGLSVQTLNKNNDVSVYECITLRLQSFVRIMMSAIMLCTSVSAYSASAHDGANHAITEHNTSKKNTHKPEGAHTTEAAEKVYPSRAAQDVVIPLAPGATLHKMNLSHHELEPWSFVPKRKDRIEIKNLSNITHALYVTYPNGTVVNLEIQIPGDIVSWTVPDHAEGEYIFRCWIHPVIRASMIIKE